MYKCQNCGETIGPNIKQHKVVTEKRLNAQGHWEIVKEVSVCPKCLPILEKAVRETEAQ